MKNINFKDPILITGCTNSGSKILFYTLLQHPELGGFDGELRNLNIPIMQKFISRLFAIYPQFNKYCITANRTDKLLGCLDNNEARKRIMHKLESADTYGDGNRVILKSPLMSLRLKWFREVFPDSYILIMLRKPHAVVEGIKRRSGGKPDIPICVAQWLTVNAILRMDTEGMGRVKFCRYSDIVENSKFPSNDDRFWGCLFNFLELDSEGFTVPNSSKYSIIEGGYDRKSMEALESWEIKFISLATDGFVKQHERF